MKEDVERNQRQVKSLNERLLAAESKAKELQLKYDESKRNYFKLRGDRERLKGELEKGGSANEESMGQAVAAGGEGAGPQRKDSNASDVNQKYEHLKTKFRVSDQSTIPFRDLIF